MPHKDPEIRRAYRKAYYEKHKEHDFVRNKEYTENHRKQKRAYAKKYYDANKEKVLAHTRNYRIRLRKETLNAYGDKCACCGESEPKFLAIDHINGGGNKHRQSLKDTHAGWAFYQWLRKNGFPGGYQLLCNNCNCAKSYWGECPHETARRNEDYAI